MNINGNSWIHGYGSQHQLFYTTMNQQPHGYYPHMEQTNFGNIIGFSNIPQQRNHHIMAGSSSGYVNIREHQRNRYPNNCNTQQQNMHQQSHHQHHHKQQQQQQQNPQNMSNNNGIINGLKNFVNGFINPTLNCNFYTDRHHRNYDPKYRNNFMRNEQHNQQPQHSKSEPLQTVFFNLSVEPKIISTQLTTSNINKPTKVMEESATSIDEVDHCHRPTEKYDNIAIFTLDDFPELPVPKQKMNFKFWHQPEKTKDSCLFYDLKTNCKNKRNKMKENKKENTKSPINITKAPTIDDDGDSSDHSSNSNNNGGCSNGLSNSFSTNPENVQQERLNNNRTDSECDSSDSEDNFIIFTNQSPSKYETIINCHSNNKSGGCTPFRPKTRQRHMSECSDDSFIICFTDDAAEGVIEFSDGNSSSDEDDDTDDTDYETDDDDDEESNDETDYKNNDNKVVSNKKITSNNQKTENNINNTNDDILSINGVNGSQPDSGFDEHKEKKVRFNLNLEIHIMHTWNFAYRAARKGHWENYVRDRSRFGNRIERVSSILNPILDSKHREKIYNLRFCDNDTIS